MMYVLRSAVVQCTVLAILSVSVWAAELPSPVQAAVDRMAKAMEVSPDAVEVVSAELVDWPDSSLGAPRPDRVYLQVITPGYRVVLRAGGEVSEYHTDMGRRVVLAETQAAERATEVSPAATLARDDLARRLALPADEISVIKVAPTTFPNTALGLPFPGEAYAAVLTPGSVVVLEARSSRYLYTATERTTRYGGPLQSWLYSALYVEPVTMDPNLNGNLVQVSLRGSNPVTLITGVSRFHAQHDGSIFAIRRTSRSGHTLLHLPAGDTYETREVAGAFDFGEVVLNPSASGWAALSREMVRGPWCVMRNSLQAPASEAIWVPLPDEGKPERLYWTGGEPVVQFAGETFPAYFTMVRNGEDWTWKKLEYFITPESELMQLNKSQHLEARGEAAEGGDVVTVARVWFTGDRDPVVSIPGMIFKSFDLAPDRRFALVTGKSGDATRAVTVDLATGEILDTVTGAQGNVGLLLAPPRAWSQMLPLVVGD